MLQKNMLCLSSDSFPGFFCSSLYCVSQFLDAFAKLQEATVSFVMSVCPSVLLSTWNNLLPTGRFLMKLDIELFSKIYQEKFKLVKICQE
jgi:hypothetical protein